MGRTWRKRKRQMNGKRKSIPNTDSSETPSSSFYLTFVNLLRWAHIKHHFSTRLRLVDFPDTGRGMQTKQAIQAGDSIIKVPESMLITSAVALGCSEFSKQLGKQTTKPNAIELLAVYLLYEANQGTKSPWFAYIASLPNKFTTPLYWEERYCLDHDLSAWVENTENQIRRSVRTIRGIFKDMRVTYHDYMWAWHVINTRSVFMKQPYHSHLSYTEREDNFALAPCLDMLNHGSEAQVQAAFNFHSRNYEIITQDNYNPYDQVFISYGCHDNRTLLKEYGFIIPGNSHHVVKFSADDIFYCTGATKSETMKTRLNTSKLDRGLFCSRDGLSWNVSAAIAACLSITKNSQCDLFDMSRAVEKLLHQASYQLQGYIEKLDKLSRDCSSNTLLRSLYMDEMDILKSSLIMMKDDEYITSLFKDHYQ